MNKEELKEILEEHAKYLNGDPDGERADLCNANLRDANLLNTNLHGAYLLNTNLHGAYLRDANLRDANLFDANLHGADLHDADLCDVNLRDANLRDANLFDANLYGADLHDADLYGANIDFSCLPLWCGSLHVHFDNRQMIQILYHLLSVVSYSRYASEEMKKALLTPELCEIANKFHRVTECGKIPPMDLSEEAI